MAPLEPRRKTRRASREQAIIAATRPLFDERGMRDARVEDIARAAGLNKALIYRAFSSKDEIFALAATSYLDELRARTDALKRSRMRRSSCVRS